MLVHIAQGQPARWLELASVRHSNTVKGGYCNMFINNSIVAIATQYYKGYYLSSDVKIIH